MAHWRLGRPAEARKWSGLARTWNDLASRAARLPAAPGHYWKDTHEWYFAHALYRDAKGLIEGGGKPQIVAGSKPSA